MTALHAILPPPNRGIALRLLPLLAMTACVTPVPVEDCSWDAAGELMLRSPEQVAPGGHVDGDPLPYGTPPQGGVPYIPLQVLMLDGAEVTERLEVIGTLTDLDSGEELAAAEQSSAFFCTNTGPYLGYWFGNELHLRAPGHTLEELRGRRVQAEVSVWPDPEGDALVLRIDGVLEWSLGPGAQEGG